MIAEISRVTRPISGFSESKILNFSTSHELIRLLKESTSLAENFLAIRTEGGPLNGELRVANTKDSGYISLISDQSLFFCSKTFCGNSICFSAVTNERGQIKGDHYHNYSNNLLSVLDNILTGFSKEPNFRFFIYPEGKNLHIPLRGAQTP